MRTRVHTALRAAVLVLSCTGASGAAITPITSVQAGRNGSPPYILSSVTVGDYTVAREFLATGRSIGEALAGTSIKAADDFNLNSFAYRNDAGAWRVTQIGGKPAWTDTNGENPDFFVFEVGMNDAISVQAILRGGALGQAVSIPTSTWGRTGLLRLGLLSFAQPIGGIAFGINDLLDAKGIPLPSDSMIEGLRFNNGDVDPAGFFAVVPEPATLIVLGMGGLLAIRCRRF